MVVAAAALQSLSVADGQIFGANLFRPSLAHFAFPLDAPPAAGEPQRRRSSVLVGTDQRAASVTRGWRGISTVTMILSLSLKQVRHITTPVTPASGSDGMGSD